MGTRYEDQPPELWAGPESLDPTPVWKQFALVGIFLALGLVLVGGVAVFAAAPQLVTPPALVPGDRLVLSLGSLPPNNVTGAGAPATAVGPPLVDDSRRFLLGRVDATDIVAIRALWSPTFGQPECPVTAGIVDGRTGYLAWCGGPVTPIFMFDARGNPINGATRGLDRYLVSVAADRVIVNLDRLIVAPERSSAPPTP
jgi:hypothetical protein